VTTATDRYQRAFPVFRQVAEGLCAAHETAYLDELGFEVRAVLHGDVKPANVIVDKTNHARLVDFLQLDVQRLIDPRMLSPDILRRSIPITGAMGTPGYMALEQERHGVVTAATDIYGLGITFAHVLADSETSNPVFDLQRNRKVPEAFRALVLRMVDPKPENRPRQMRDVLGEPGVG